MHTILHAPQTVDLLGSHHPALAGPLMVPSASIAIHRLPTVVTLFPYSPPESHGSNPHPAARQVSAPGDLAWHLRRDLALSIHFRSELGDYRQLLCFLLEVFDYCRAYRTIKVYRSVISTPRVGCNSHPGGTTSVSTQVD